MRKLHPLLRLAAISGVETAVALHIRRGDDLDARDGGGATPLMLAAARKKKGVVRHLLDAGANPTLVDSNGMDALAHATASGCPATVALLIDALARASTPDSESSCSIPAENRESIVEYDSSVTSETRCEASGCSAGETETLADNLSPSDICDGDGSEVPRVVGATTDTPELEFLSFDDEPLGEDFRDDWEAEEDAVAPEGDKTVAELARQVHEIIGRHKAVDFYEGWDDVDLHLPERSAPLLREDADWAVRALLLAALRDGVVSEGALAEACSDVDGTRNYEAERMLGFVATELGATVVEWAGKENPFWGEPSPEEERLLDEATEFARDLASGRNDPFRFYYREIRGDLLAAEEEIALARQIEEAGRDALVALANWPEGLVAVLDAADRVARGEADAKSFSTAAEISPEDEPTLRIETFDQDEDDDARDNEDASAFVSAVAAVRAAAGDTQRGAEALVAVRLTRRFLFDLAARAQSDPAGADFVKALGRQTFARERMTLCNLRLALSIARKYLWSGVPLDDLVQEANIGLMKAVERYDWRRGFRFSTYATWWIRQQVTRSIADTAKVVRAPVHIQETARKVIREREAVEAKLGRHESDVETARRIGMSPSKTVLLLTLFDEAESLDEFDPETGRLRVDLLVDPRASDPAEIVERVALHSTLVNMLDELGERSRAVVSLRFGLGDDDALTLEDVGQRFGVTRERIRQIEAKALRKLSLHSRKLILAPFVGEACMAQQLSETAAPSGSEFRVVAPIDSAPVVGASVRRFFGTGSSQFKADVIAK